MRSKGPPGSRALPNKAQLFGREHAFPLCLPVPWHERTTVVLLMWPERSPQTHMVERLASILFA